MKIIWAASGFCLKGTLAFDPPGGEGRVLQYHQKVRGAAGSRQAEELE